MKLCKKLLAALLAAALFLCCVPAFAAGAERELPGGYDYEVYFDVEAFTMGWGFIVEPVAVPANEGENLATITMRALDLAGLQYTYGGTVDSGFYLRGIACDKTEPNVPQYLMDELNAYPAWAEENMGYSFGEWTGSYTDDGILMEMEYSGFAGWMFAVDDVAASVGADGVTVTDGMTIRWMFSVYGWGMDCGLNDGWGMFPEFDNPAEGVLRSEAVAGYAKLASDPIIVSKLMAGGAAYSAKNAFISTVSNIASSQAEIDAAYAALLDACYEYTVYVDFEAFTMGWGFLAEPVAVPANPGENAATVTLRALEMLDIDCVYGGSPTSGFYLRGVECPYTEPNIPQYLMDQFDIYPAWADDNLGFAYGSWTGTYTDDGILMEMENSTFAGWMFTVNDVSASLGADGIAVEDGTMYRWMFSVYGWGMDCGISDGWGMFPEFDNPAYGVERAEVMVGSVKLAEDPIIAPKLAEGGEAHDEYEAFIAVVSNIASTQAEIDAAYAALLDACYEYTVYVDFEAFTMGWGFLAEPVAVPANPGENAATVTLRALEMLDMDCVYGGSPTSGFYLRGVECPYTEPNVPAYLMNELLAYPEWADEEWGYSFGNWTGTYTDDGILMEMEYSTFAGWMFTVNDVSADLGADGIAVEDGTMYRWMFSIYGWGMDCGISDGWGMFPEFDNPAEGVERSPELIGFAELAADPEYAVMMAEGGAAHEEYMAFIAVAGSLTSAESEIEAAYAALLSALNGGGEYLLGDADCNGELTFSDVSLMYLRLIGISWLTVQGEVNADFDCDGELTFSDITLLALFLSNE